MTYIDVSRVPKTGWAELDECNVQIAQAGNTLVELTAKSKPDSKHTRAQLMRFLELGNRLVENEGRYMGISGSHRVAWRARYFRSVLLQLSQVLNEPKCCKTGSSNATVRNLIEGWLDEHFGNSPYMHYHGTSESQAPMARRLYS